MCRDGTPASAGQIKVTGTLRILTESSGAVPCCLWVGFQPAIALRGRRKAYPTDGVPSCGVWTVARVEAGVSVHRTCCRRRSPCHRDDLAGSECFAIPDIDCVPGRTPIRQEAASSCHAAKLCRACWKRRRGGTLLYRRDSAHWGECIVRSHSKPHRAAADYREVKKAEQARVCPGIESAVWLFLA